MRLLRTEIRKLEQKIDMDEKMKKMGDMQLSTVTDGKKRKTILEQVRSRVSAFSAQVNMQVRLRPLPLKPLQGLRVVFRRSAALNLKALLAFGRLTFIKKLTGLLSDTVLNVSAAASESVTQLVCSKFLVDSQEKNYRIT